MLDRSSRTRIVELCSRLLTAARQTFVVSARVSRTRSEEQVPRRGSQQQGLKGRVLKSSV